MNDELDTSLAAQANAPAKLNLKSLPQRLLNISIHATHITWMVALVVSVSKNGALQSYALFMPLLILASFLEIWRWALLGRQIVEVKGAYFHASAVETANREFLLFSWYVVPPFPPFKLLERYATGISDVPTQKTLSQIFARFWLKSEVTWPLLILELVCISVLYPGSAPEIYGLGRFHPLACLFWIAGFGALSKSASAFSYSTFIRFSKGF